MVSVRITTGGPLSKNMQLHGGNPCYKTHWTKEWAGLEMGGLPKGTGQWERTYPDLLAMKALVVAEPATHCKKTGKGAWVILEYTFHLPYTFQVFPWYLQLISGRDRTGLCWDTLQLLLSEVLMILARVNGTSWVLEWAHFKDSPPWPA